MTRSIRSQGPLIVLVLLAAIGCGDDGENAAGIRALPAPQAIEAASGVLLSTSTALLTIFSGVPGLERTASAPPAGLPALVTASLPVLGPVISAGDEAVGGGSAVMDCPCGGTLDAFCDPGFGTSTIVASLDGCCDVIDARSGLFLTGDGGFSVAFTGANACGDAPLPLDVPTAVKARNFVSVLSLAGSLLQRREANFSESIEPAGFGCFGEQSDRFFDGTLSVESEAAALGLAIDGRELRLSIRSGGPPCHLRMAADGHVEVADEVGKRSFAQDLHGLTLTFEPQFDGSARLTLRGSVTNPCLGGEVRAETIESLLLIPGSPCPSGGSLMVTLSSGDVGLVRFLPDGVEIESPGMPVRTFTSCADPTLTQCR